ncbi:hypothetical protein [Streptomyces sp. 351MFTsu5.1]|uniref:hypothetical protein n=1 Tax=Streptomyces sp. 351MFTsu5.1 TaxID=1172180 RepID=UPI000378EB2A|nr:hypothetical protein [Streptomyces sp. 351MFTsu5.1]
MTGGPPDSVYHAETRRSRDGENTNWFIKDLPLLIAFAKNTLIYPVIVVAIIYIPIYVRLGCGSSTVGQSRRRAPMTAVWSM